MHFERRWWGSLNAFFSLTVLTSDSPADGAPILAQEPSDVAKNVRMMVSGIVSYTRWPALSGPPKLCIFSSSRFSTALQENAATSFALSACHHSHSTRGDDFRLQWFLFWQRVTDIPDGINRTISVKGVIINCRTKYRVHYW